MGLCSKGRMGEALVGYLGLLPRTVKIVPALAPEAGDTAPSLLNLLPWETCHHSSLLGSGPAPFSQHCLQMLPGWMSIH